MVFQKTKAVPLCKCGCGLPTGKYFSPNGGRFRNYLAYIPEHLPTIIKDGKKRCTKCKEWKSVDEFYGSSRKTGGLMGECKVCNKKRARETKIRLYGSDTNYYRIRRYGLNQDAVDAIIMEQNGLCAICQLRKPIAIDHCHTINKVRGILCNACNSALGVFKEDLKIFQRAIEYLGLSEADL